MTNSMSKKRMRNNSAVSFKSSTSSISDYSGQKIDQKSTFANVVNWNNKEQCQSEFMRELIKALVHLMEVEPQPCT